MYNIYIYALASTQKTICPLVDVILRSNKQRATRLMSDWRAHMGLNHSKVLLSLLKLTGSLASTPEKYIRVQDSLKLN